MAWGKRKAAAQVLVSDKPVGRRKVVDAPVRKCGCGRACAPGHAYCPRCERTIAADVRAAKGVDPLPHPCPNAWCNRTMRGGVCPNPDC